MILTIIAICLGNFGAGCAGFVGYCITGAAWMRQEMAAAPIVD